MNKQAFWVPLFQEPSRKKLATTNSEGQRACRSHHLSLPQPRNPDVWLSLASRMFFQKCFLIPAQMMFRSGTMSNRTRISYFTVVAHEHQVTGTMEVTVIAKYMAAHLIVLTL